MKYRKAFTLIELLVVIAIIGILATISVIALQNARAKSRDAKRVGDMKQIQTALELFFNDKGRYPTATEWNTNQIYSTSSAGTSTYMQVIPSAPTPADGSCSNGRNSFSYSSESDSTYTISFCVGNTTGTLTAGNKCATPGGIVEGICCPVSVLYDGQTYNTVTIGDQCWMKENLNVGTMVSGVTEQTDNSTLEKYCYDDNSANCTIDGGLYQRDEAMQYVATEGTQGICPTGWHVPTDAEWHTLELFYAVPSTEANCSGSRNSSYACSPAGTALLDGGSSGFDGIVAGYRVADGSFNLHAAIMYFRSSSLSDWTRYMEPGVTSVGRYASASNLGFSVRCIK